ncbi:MAG TPA: hypothetical protein VKA48_03780 [Gammaproteobacteria bacterium]|nr:hypothetical protein [Gammaproteobacteria bacterium]
MVFRLVGLVGLILLSWSASAAEVDVHQALGKWLQDGGCGSATYQPENGGGELPGDWPGWLIHPRDADALSTFFLRHGLYPEAVNLDWEKGLGVVRVFGTRQGQKGLRLIVDRGGERPVRLRTAKGVQWRFTNYQARPGRHAELPGRVIRIGPNGERTAFTVR